MVQITSISALCVVRDGVGLARALKRTMMTQQQDKNESRDRGDDPEQEIVKRDDVRP